MGIMPEFCFNTGRNRAKQHSSIADWSWLNKNMKDRLFNCFILNLTSFILSTTWGRFLMGAFSLHFGRLEWHQKQVAFDPGALVTLDKK